MVVVPAVITAWRYLRLRGHPFLDNVAEDRLVWWTSYSGPFFVYIQYLVLLCMNCLSAPMLEDSPLDGRRVSRITGSSSAGAK